MRNTVANSAFNAPGADASAALAVCSCPEDERMLRSIFHDSRRDLVCVRTLADAKRYLHQNVVPVVLCDSDLPDGHWRDLWHEVADQDFPPKLVVATAKASNALWAEVLHVGGFDVIVKPYRKGELFRVLSLAWRHWHDMKANPAVHSLAS